MGYLLKDAVPEELIPTIREVYAGRRSLSSTVEARLEARMRQPTLTLREVQVLELLAKGMRNKEIAGELAISGETARAHVRSIFVKLQVHDRTAALAEALRRGIVYLDS
jgi:DNA-binding NarL/FixJ family response regulator